MNEAAGIDARAWEDAFPPQTELATSIAAAVRVQPENPRRMVTFIPYGRNNAGVMVTPETALMVSAVWACIDVISKAIASSDWFVYLRKPNGDRDLKFDDPLSYLLNVRPNTDMTAISFRRALMIAVLAWGNGYAEIVRDQAGRVAELWPIRPDRVMPQRRASDGVLYFEVRNDDGTKADLEAADMFHIRGPGMNGLFGDNMVAKAARTIALAIAQERFAEAYFGNNAQMGGILEYPGAIDDPTYARLKEQWGDRHEGPNKAFRVGFIEGGVKWHEVQVNAEGAQLVPARQQQLEEVCRWFGVPPHKIQHLMRATFTNVENLGMEFSRDGLRPWARELQQEADYKLFSRRGPDRFTLIDLAWASQGDFLSRAQGYQIMRNIGTYSANDILKKEGENTIGKEGDIRVVNGALIPLEDVGKNMTPSGGAKPADLPDDQGDASRESARNAFVAAFAMVFGRVEARHRAQATDARSNSRNPDKTLEQVRERAEGFLREQLAQPCAAFSASVSRDTFAAAFSAGRDVLDGGQVTERAEAFVDYFMRIAPQ